jgi:putative endonuclease
MAEHLETGKIGEEKAAAFLVENGYEIVERNYRHKHAEIDLIARKGKMLIFVEVKTRTNVSYGMPEASVDYTKAKLVMRVAEKYIFDKDWMFDVRFDVIAIIINNDKVKITHFEDAFS